ncbi:unnamed protein product [Amoebophrya sp. A25]|nr:unnamed protein product [Amoebophrya sp. A25]|eukprot:GSA25T00003286001.1
MSRGSGLTQSSRLLHSSSRLLNRSGLKLQDLDVTSAEAKSSKMTKDKERGRQRLFDGVQGDQLDESSTGPQAKDVVVVHDDSAPAAQDEQAAQEVDDNEGEAASPTAPEDDDQDDDEEELDFPSSLPIPPAPRGHGGGLLRLVSAQDDREDVFNLIGDDSMLNGTTTTNAGAGVDDLHLFQEGLYSGEREPQRGGDEALLRNEKDHAEGEGSDRVVRPRVNRFHLPPEVFAAAENVDEIQKALEGLHVGGENPNTITQEEEEELHQQAPRGETPTTKIVDGEADGDGGAASSSSKKSVDIKGDNSNSNTSSRRKSSSADAASNRHSVSVKPRWADVAEDGEGSSGRSQQYLFDNSSFYNYGTAGAGNGLASRSGGREVSTAGAAGVSQVVQGNSTAARAFSASAVEQRRQEQVRLEARKLRTDMEKEMLRTRFESEQEEAGKHLLHSLCGPARIAQGGDHSRRWIEALLGRANPTWRDKATFMNLGMCPAAYAVRQRQAAASTGPTNQTVQNTTIKQKEDHNIASSSPSSSGPTPEGGRGKKNPLAEQIEAAKRRKVTTASGIAAASSPDDGEQRQPQTGVSAQNASTATTTSSKMSSATSSQHLPLPSWQHTIHPHLMSGATRNFFYPSESDVYHASLRGLDASAWAVAMGADSYPIPCCKRNYDICHGNVNELVRDEVEQCIAVLYANELNAMMLTGQVQMQRPSL